MKKLTEFLSRSKREIITILCILILLIRFFKPDLKVDIYTIWLLAIPSFLYIAPELAKYVRKIKVQDNEIEFSTALSEDKITDETNEIVVYAEDSTKLQKALEKAWPVTKDLLINGVYSPQEAIVETKIRLQDLKDEFTKQASRQEMDYETFLKEIGFKQEFITVISEYMQEINKIIDDNEIENEYNITKHILLGVLFYTTIRFRIENSLDTEE
jgi:hypothetical protein